MDKARERILDTAEQLFASQGVAAVTVRAIATAAGVNLAALHYYFGSKERLFEEMFVRRVTPLNERRLAMLAACEAAQDGGPPPLEGIIRAFVVPALDLLHDANPAARTIVVQFLLGRIMAMPEVNAKLTQFYELLRTRFVDALSRALPQMSEEEVIWRYYWMGGSIMTSLAIDPAVVAGLKVNHRVEADAEQLIAFLVSACRGT